MFKSKFNGSCQKTMKNCASRQKLNFSICDPLAYSTNRMMDAKAIIIYALLNRMCEITGRNQFLIDSVFKTALVLLKRKPPKIQMGRKQIDQFLTIFLTIKICGFFVHTICKNFIIRSYQNYLQPNGLQLNLYS